MKDEELLAESNALDAAYAAAQLHDAQYRVQYLERVLKNLVDNVTEDVPREVGTDHLWASVEDAEEALGYYDVE
jgi:hypothetical protein